MTIILDAMGSDDHPTPELQAAVDSARLLGEEIILVGNEEILRPRLQALNPQGLPVTIEHAPEVLEMTDKPVEGARKKPRNSMSVGIELLKAGRGQAFVTAGNTGAANFIALRTLGRMKGVQRSPLTAIIPTKTGHCIVLDIGANADCRPEFLVQFALMGSLYAQAALQISQPRVGVLTIGEESGKGNLLVKETLHLLESLSHSSIHYIGNVEPKEMYGGHADVVVTDGFTGNIMVKTSEAVAKLLLTSLKTELTASPITTLGAALAKPAFGRVAKMMDPDEVGAGILLGVEGLVFVGHGKSNVRALTNAIRAASRIAKTSLLNDLRQGIQTLIATSALSASEPTASASAS